MSVLRPVEFCGISKVIFLLTGEEQEFWLFEFVDVLLNKGDDKALFDGEDFNTGERLGALYW